MTQISASSESTVANGLPDRPYVIHYIQGGFPAQVLSGFGGVVERFSAAGVAVDHFDFSAEGAGDVHDGVVFGGAEGVSVTVSFFAGEDDAAGEVFHIGKCAALRAGRHDRERLAGAVAAFELG